jgi:hypothetical protein
MTRTGDSAARFYALAERRFEEADNLQSDSALLLKNWSSVLARQAYDLHLTPESWERARQNAVYANSLEPAAGSYNLACIAASTEERVQVSHWLSHAAE